MELLEESGVTELSLRAVARRAGVSHTAPYRHYADREALLCAVTAVGYRELAGRLAAAHAGASAAEHLAGVAITYVEFALERPALFRMMCTEPRDCASHHCDASPALSDVVGTIARRYFSEADADALGTALWAAIHGLALLFLDGKVTASAPTPLADRITAVIQAIVPREGIAARSHPLNTPGPTSNPS